MSLSYLEIEGIDIVVKIRWFEKFSYFLSILGMIFSFLMYIINWIIFAFNRNLDSFINASMLTFGTGLLFFFFGNFLFPVKARIGLFGLGRYKTFSTAAVSQN